MSQPNYRIEHGLPENLRSEAAKLFWQAFAGKLGKTLGPYKKALVFIEDILDPAFAISALSTDGRLLGMAGLGYMYGCGLGVKQNTKTALSWMQKAEDAGNTGAQKLIGWLTGAGRLFEIPLSELAEAAEAGDADAQYVLGRRYAKGEAGVRNKVKGAYEWYQKAAEQGHADAQYFLGDAYRFGRGLWEEDTTEAHLWFEKSAVQGDPWTAYALGLMYENGEGVDEDPQTAFAWYRKAADGGEVISALLKVAEAYLEGGVADTDAAEAAIWFERAAEAGSTKAETRLGDLYRKGLGVAKDLETAKSWYQRAAEEGDEDARQWVVWIERTDETPEQTIQRYQSEFAQGEQEAAFNLARLYQSGTSGLQADPAKAADWYRTAADAGHVRAQYELGRLHEDGEGVTQSDLAAMRWFRVASEQDFAEAQYRLAMLYLIGRGAERDPAKGYFWMNRAHLGGAENAGKALNRFRRSLNPAQMSDITAEAKAWQPSEEAIAKALVDAQRPVVEETVRRQTAKSTDGEVNDEGDAFRRHDVDPPTSYNANANSRPISKNLDFASKTVF
ncbi:MAG: tetratricopeptide repeat protein [Roseibium sp.]